MNHNDVELSEMTYNGNDVGEWIHNGVSVFSSAPVGESYEFSYKGSVEEFVVPYKALYKLEVWGAQGGTYGGGTIGGYGGYSVGYIQLSKGQKIYICVGGISTKSGGGATAYGGYNGGGNAYSYWGCGGGGATHIASSNRGTLASYSSNATEIIIVAGGGGGGSNNSGKGGAGGGLTGGTGGGGVTYGKGGSQTSGGAYGGSFGKGGSYQSSSAGGGGGGGYYGGGAGGSANTAGGGGSSYIGGVPEITYKGTTYTPSTTSGVNGNNNGSTQTLAPGNKGKAKITIVA